MSSLDDLARALGLGPDVKPSRVAVECVRDMVRALDSFFDARTLTRGRAYFKQGRVLSVVATGQDRWVADVAGGERDPYQTTLTLRRNKTRNAVSTACTCPVGGACKHVVAAVLELEASLAEDNAPPGVPRKDASTAWLDALAQRLDAPQDAARSPANARLAYWIGPYQDRPLLRTLHLELGRIRQSKRGGFMPGRPRDHYLDPSYPHDPHRAVAAWLEVIFSPAYTYQYCSYNDACYLEHPQAPSLVRAMARTGSLYYGDDKQTPLRWSSSPRAAALAWTLQADLQQQLGLGLPEHVRAILGEEALYIDPETHEIGPLKLDMPAAVAEAVSAAPTLAPKESEAFAARLDERLKQYIPAPQKPRQRTQRLKPTPVLTLREDREAPAAGVLRARVSFRYGDHHVDALASESEATYIEGDTVVTLPRDAEAEAGALRQLGLSIDGGVEEDAPAPLLDLAPHLDDSGDAALGNTGDTQAYARAIERLAPLRAAGWSVAASGGPPREIIDVDEPVELTVEDADELGPGLHWFDLRMGVEVDGEQVDLAPLIAAALERPEIGLQSSDWATLGPRVFLPLDSRRIIALPTDRLKVLMGAMRELLSTERLGLGNALELTHLLDTGACTLRGRAFVIELARRLRACEAGVTQAPPKGLQGDLRPYQQHGLSWLAFLRAHELAGVLADDMGLGKTLQTIAHLLGVQERGEAEGPFLIVMPTSLLFNWSAELQRFAPGLQVHLHHGPQRKLEKLPAGAVMLTSYGVLLRDAEALAAIAFDTVVLDEAHAIKNPRAKLHHAARGLQAKHRLCLTGTPLQNHLEELWALFAFGMPGLLDSHAQFSKLFRSPIEKDHDPGARAQLAARVRPFMLRRKKADVARDLPPKTEMIEKLELVDGQRDLYETVRNLMDARVRTALEKRGIAASSIVVLDALLKLRQVCCDPRLVKVGQAKRVKGSAKLERLLELVDELVDEGRRVLIFSQFTSMLALIGSALEARRIAYTQLTGKTRDRARVVKDFQDGTAPVFLLSLKAGGVGLNLTAADTVIHYDPWWNPAAENQATDRAHRIGQDKPVFVYKLIAAGSVEERILELQQRKLQLSQGLVNEGAIAQQLSQHDLDRLFAPLA